MGDEARRFYSQVVLAYDGDECLIWPFQRNRDGYATIPMKPGSRLVSRRLCEEAHGPAPTPDHEAAHSCGKGGSGCVTKRHLSWKTSAENHEDMVRHGTSTRGERHYGAKLTVSKVQEIRQLCGTRTQRQIAAIYGVGQGTIADISTRKTWGWV